MLDEPPAGSIAALARSSITGNILSASFEASLREAPQDEQLS
jgi:hypothetical protein